MKKSLLICLFSLLLMGFGFLIPKHIDETVKVFASEVLTKNEASGIKLTNSGNAAAYLNPLDLNFIEDFEGVNGWEILNGTQFNKWYVGNAVNNGGNKALYISDDNGVTNKYSTSASTVFAYRQLAIPAGTTMADLRFDWRAKGDGTNTLYDYFRVWIVPVTYTPVPGTLITAANGRVQVGGGFNLQENWVTYNGTVNLAAFAGQSMRLVFEWRNNSSGWFQPPAAIDNIQLKAITCPPPKNITTTKSAQGNVIVEWEPGGTETTWEVVVQPSNLPAPNAQTVGAIVNDIPKYTFLNPQEGVFYKVYIRAMCTNDDKGIWTVEEQFSLFNPPACAEVRVDPLDLQIDKEGDYIYCEGTGEKIIHLNAEFETDSFKRTNEYTVESIPYDPPFPLTGGIQMNISLDDTWSPVIKLPFKVCFYDQSFSTAQVSSNGVVSFGTTYAANVSATAPYSMNGFNSFPNPTYLTSGGIPNGSKLKNCILGVYQDIDPTIVNQGSKPNINYQVLGTYPCRALVVNYKDIKLYSSVNGCSTSYPGQNYQIVIYEATNIIEVYVGNRNSCSAFNAGKGAIGLINKDQTEGTFPPNRNIGTWNAQNEAWRFRPSGDAYVEFGWYANGVLISNNPIYDVTINEPTTFEARASYSGCVGESFSINKKFTVKVGEEPVITKPDVLKTCTYHGVMTPVNLNDLNKQIKDKIIKKDKFEVSYYETAADAEGDVSKLLNTSQYASNTLPKTLYARMESIDTGCYAITVVEIVQEDGVAITKPDDIVLCVYEAGIPATDLKQVEKKLMSAVVDADKYRVEYYETQQGAVLEQNSISNITTYKAASLPKTIYVRVTNNDFKCDAVSSFQLLAGEMLTPYDMDDVYICSNYVLPKLPQDYYYSTENHGNGELIKPGKIYKPGKYVVFTNIMGKDGCVASSKLNIEVIPCAITKGISPNGDGLNDAFNLTLFQPVSVVIYNRNGNEVFNYGLGYTNQWYGQDKSGKTLPDGTYFYVVRTATEELSGYVQIVREIN